MRSFLLIAVFALYLCGCFAIVDESSGEKKVKSFMITKDETLDMLEQMDEKEPNREFNIELFKQKKK